MWGSRSGVDGLRVGFSRIGRKRPTLIFLGFLGTSSQQKAASHGAGSRSRQEAQSTVSLIRDGLRAEARPFCLMGRYRPRLRTGLAEVVSYVPGSSPNRRNFCLKSPQLLDCVGPLQSPGGGVPGGTGEFTRPSTADLATPVPAAPDPPPGPSSAGTLPCFSAKMPTPPS